MTEIYANVSSIVRCSTTYSRETSFLLNLQGCTLRCLHCATPEIRSCNVNKKMSVTEIVSEVNNVINFIKNGGVVVSGGEPLIQTDFLIEFFKTIKGMGIKTTLETSGMVFNTANPKFDELLKYTDFVILNIKHINSENHLKLTGQTNTNALEFAKYLSFKRIPVGINYIAIPTVNTNNIYLVQLGEFLAELENIKTLDVVPFINSSAKYKDLNMDYLLKDIKTPSLEYIQKVKKTIVDAMRNAKSSK